jgi:hypothetical protein
MEIKKILFYLLRLNLKILLFRKLPTNCAMDRSWLGKLRYFFWLRLNEPSSLTRQPSRGGRFGSPELRSKLARDGIVVGATSEIVDADTSLFAIIQEDFKRALLSINYEDKKCRAGFVSPVKSYTTKITLFENIADSDHPLVQLAYTDKLVDLVEGYLEVRATLYDYAVYLNYPVSDLAQHSQVWHRDPEDLRLVKVFIYLTEVSDYSGPFIYIPGTQPKGRYSHIMIPSSHQWRIQDREIEPFFQKEAWLTCTGSIGTVVVADTVGLHKGGFTRSGHRGVIVLTYSGSNPLIQARRNGSHRT